MATDEPCGYCGHHLTEHRLVGDNEIEQYKHAVCGGVTTGSSCVVLNTYNVCLACHAKFEKLVR